jgi:hypothetical protein
MPVTSKHTKHIHRLAKTKEIHRLENALVQLKARMHEPLRARLEESAKRRGVSLNSELVDRVEASFTREDWFGGPEIANMARLMAAAFMRGGQRAAHARKHPRWTTAQWLHDPFCYEAACTAVVEALRALKPVQFEQMIGEMPHETMRLKQDEFESMLDDTRVRSQPVRHRSVGEAAPLTGQDLTLVVDEAGVVKVAPLPSEGRRMPSNEG